MEAWGSALGIQRESVRLSKGYRAKLGNSHSLLNRSPSELLLAAALLSFCILGGRRLAGVFEAKPQEAAWGGARAVAVGLALVLLHLLGAVASAAVWWL